MAVRSALPRFVVVWVQCDLDCNMVDELEQPVAAAAAVPAAGSVVAFVDTALLDFDGDSADTAQACYSDDSADTGCCLDGFVGSDGVNYFDDAATDTVPAIHSTDKVLEHTAVPSNLHSCYALEADLVRSNSHDYDWPQPVDWAAEGDIALVAEKWK